MCAWVALLSAVGAAAAAPAGAATGSGWPGYLAGPKHQSHSPETAITPAKAPHLAAAWTWRPPAAMPGQPAAELDSSPTVAGGTIYIGSNTGQLFALAEATGSVLWSRDLGHTPSLTCNARGITSTATVAPDASRAGTATVYTGGGDGNLYALDAATGVVVWQTLVAPPGATENTYYLWSSPTVVAGHVYIGLSSQCDEPLVRGGVVEVDQATGAVLASWYSVPEGAVGASVWTSVAASADGSAVYATTGNGDDVDGDPQGDSQSVVRLDGATLERQSIWTVPPDQHGPDSDFGSSPVIFSASVGGVSTMLLAACNKNGVLYAWRRDALGQGPVWQRRIDTPTAVPGCLGAAAFDGSSLLQSGGATTIGGISYRGSVRALAPGTGSVRWQRGIQTNLLGSPSVDSARVLAVPGQGGDAPGVYLLNARTGVVLKRLTTLATYAQPVFADGYLFTASMSGGLTAWRP